MPFSCQLTSAVRVTITLLCLWSSICEKISREVSTAEVKDLDIQRKTFISRNHISNVCSHIYVYMCIYV